MPSSWASRWASSARRASGPSSPPCCSTSAPQQSAGLGFAPLLHARARASACPISRAGQCRRPAAAPLPRSGAWLAWVERSGFVLLPDLRIALSSRRCCAGSRAAGLWAALLVVGGIVLGLPRHGRRRAGGLPLGSPALAGVGGHRRRAERAPPAPRRESPITWAPFSDEALARATRRRPARC